MAKKINSPFDRVHFVNHSHVDHTWWDSPEICRKRNDEIINNILEISASDPDFKFSYETTAALIGYLERHPERKEEIADLLRQGRMDVGGLFVSANDDACTDETIARNFYFGKRWLEKNLAYSPGIAKEYDTPGHPLQMPQLVRNAGMQSMVISRGPQGGLLWIGPDGSGLPVFCVPYNWSYWRRLGLSFEETEEKLPAELKRASGKYDGSELVIPDGDDMTLPNRNLPEIINRWNAEYDRPKLMLSTLEDFIETIKKRKLPHRSGDMPNLWVVVHALQLEATNKMKSLQNLLPCVEALYSVVCIQRGEFKRYPSQQIDSCWRRALLAADHNWGGKDENRHGPEGDQYKRDLAAGALENCKKIAEDAFYDLSKKVLTKESSLGMCVLAFNPLAWKREDVASVEITCDMPGLESIEMVDAENKAVPYGLTVLEKHRDDSIRQANVEFLGRNLPSLGYSTFYVKPVIERRESAFYLEEGGNSIENEFYRVELSEDGSRIESLYDKGLDLELAGRFNARMGPLEFEFGMFELFGIGLRLTVPDQSFFEDPNNEGSGESVEPTGEIWRASDFPAKLSVEKHRAFSSSIIADGQFIDSACRQKVVLYEGLKRVDFHLELDWKGKPDTVLYLQMPSTLMNGQRFIDLPFAVHKDGNELADFWGDENLPVRFRLRGMQDWLCFEDGGRGLAIATRWPVVDLTAVPSFPLMWTNDNSGFFVGERYRQAGKHTFSFSLTSYSGSWLDNKIHLWGKQWAKQPLTFLGDMCPHDNKQSYISVYPDNIVVSAFKKAQDEDALVVRMYEIAGKKTNAGLRVSFPIRRARTSNLIEMAEKRLAAKENPIRLSFRPYEIKTVKLYL